MRRGLAVWIVAVGLSCSATAQEAATPKTLASVMPAVIPASAGLGSPQPLLSPGPMMPIAPGPAIAPKPAPFPQSRASHSFLDKENLAIFAALAASRSMDMVSTWQFRRHGLHEVNSPTPLWTTSRCSSLTRAPWWPDRLQPPTSSIAWDGTSWSASPPWCTPVW